MHVCTLHACIYACAHMLKFVTTLRGDTEMVDTVKKTVGHLEDLVFKQRERDARQRDLVSEWQRKVPLPFADLLSLLIFGDALVSVIFACWSLCFLNYAARIHTGVLVLNLVTTFLHELTRGCAFSDSGCDFQI